MSVNTPLKCCFFYYINISTMCHVTFTWTSRLPCQEMAMMAVAWQPGEKAAKPETTVWDDASTFVSVKPRDIFGEMSGRFPAVCVATNGDVFEETSGQFPAMLETTESGKQEHNLYLNLTKCFLCTNLNISKAQCWNLITKLHKEM